MDVEQERELIKSAGTHTSAMFHTSVALCTLVEQYGVENRIAKETIAALLKEKAALTAENARLRGVLKPLADQNNWITDEDFDWVWIGDNDLIESAQRALAAEPESQP